MKAVKGALIFLLCSTIANAIEAREYQSHELSEDSLTVITSDGQVTLTPLNGAALEVHYRRKDLKQLPSFAIDPSRTQIATAELTEGNERLAYSLPGITALVHKSPFRIEYLRNEQPLVGEEIGFFANETLRGFRFALSPEEKLLGGGERVLGMDRRGQRFPLYNKAHYGYTTESDQMYFSLPAVISSNKYLLLFDNSATGSLDLGASEEDVLQFEAVGGRTSYIIVAGDSYPQLIENYIGVTGRQPLPPRWALGNFASRFGYHTEQEVRATVDKFAEEDFPLDAVVLDLYWFGPNIQGHMGNLAWDRDAFPEPEKMMADLKERGINTILVTEPFILSSSERWGDAVAANALAKNLAGQPKRFDFYFGNTGLIDVFSEDGRDWFGNIYRGLKDQGVAGWWGDLGEPEVHPSDTVHEIGLADEVHNAYGHRWAQMLYENEKAENPAGRPFIMMRSGFAGSQRYGMIPWTGDVAREWGGLQPQVELSLTMGLLGFGYTHSDLGGFAGGEKFNRELYIRWLQYGVFQPVYRPHAQEQIAPEPVFHDRTTRNILREYVKLRYRLLPYNYTLAFENSRTGMPLMRPLFFEDEDNADLIDYEDAYLWGGDFLVAPVTEAGIDEVEVRLPGGVWFDYWNDDQYSGGAAQVEVDLETIPVLVRAGAFIPTIDDISTTRDYSSEHLTLDYYAHPTAVQSSGHVYEDDGETADAFTRGQYEKLGFSALRSGDGIAFDFRRSGGGYQGMPEQREITLKIHNWQRAPGAIEIAGQTLKLHQREKNFTSSTEGAWHDKRNDRLLVKFTWGKQPLELTVKNKPEPKVAEKPVIYQILPRLFGNTNPTNKPWGIIGENGVGKFNDFTPEILGEIRELGATHIWYTGALHHALVGDYTEYGISNDDPDVVKGRAGSPYAIKDYYSVNPDLAEDPAARMDEFRALIERSHAQGLKVIIDIVPNHVARDYQSLGKPEGVRDFGADDDTSVTYARDNNFYYVTGENFKVPETDDYQPLGGEPHPLADGKFEESPAKWTGNGARAAQPDIDDWYETVKINFGVRPDGSEDFPQLSTGFAQEGYKAHAHFWADRDVPDSWEKFRHIAHYWLDFGVDGFRYDMAGMVPVEFWSYLNSSIKMKKPDALLLAEIYTPERYRNYIHLGKMDYLYDKVGTYDAIRAVMEGSGGTDKVADIQASLQDIAPHMLHFMENHDEQRIASPEFAGDAGAGKPAMLVSATISAAPTLVYFGQELGESASQDTGFGKASRTTIFDYWSVPSVRRWLQGESTAEEEQLRDFYQRLLKFSTDSAALRSDNYRTLRGYGERQFAFARWNGDEKLLIVANFANEDRELDLQLPPELVRRWRLQDGSHTLVDQLDPSAQATLIAATGRGKVTLQLGPYASHIFLVE